MDDQRGGSGMSAWELVIERIDAETGVMIDSTRTARHGWESPEAAVRNWTQRGHFIRPSVEKYRNGKQERDDAGNIVRVYFEPTEGASDAPVL